MQPLIQLIHVMTAFCNAYGGRWTLRSTNYRGIVSVVWESPAGERHWELDVEERFLTCPDDALRMFAARAIAMLNEISAGADCKPPQPAHQDRPGSTIGTLDVF